jgi:hypothetical protein
LYLSKCLVLAVIAAFVGGLFGWASVIREPGVFTTLEEITALLHVPVIAALTTGAPLRRRAVQAGVYLCEAALAGVALLVAWVAAVDPLATRLGVQNPLQFASLVLERDWPL